MENEITKSSKCCKKASHFHPKSSGATNQPFPWRLSKIFMCLSVLAVFLILALTSQHKRFVFNMIQMNAVPMNGNISGKAEKAATVPTINYPHRLQMANLSCNKSKSQRARYVVTALEGRLAYCVIQKVGCTYWKRVLRFLNNKNNFTNGSLGNGDAFELSRRRIHQVTVGDEYYDIKQMNDSRLKNAFRFMFVRDPYARLFSAWLDKLFLPDFWFTVGMSINRFFCRRGTQHPTNITFPEFLQYVVNQTARQLDSHWAPYKEMCDTCVFRPHFIGKMETFSQDAKFIFKRLNVTEVPKRSLDNGRADGQGNGHTDHSLEELRTQTQFNFDMFKTRNLRFYMGAREFAERIWKSFQYNGHLPASVPFPWQRFSFLDINETSQAFLQTAEETYANWTRAGRSKALQAQQRRQALIEAYRTVPSDVMASIQKMYRQDFQNFEYDAQPKDFYNWNMRE